MKEKYSPQDVGELDTPDIHYGVDMDRKNHSQDVLAMYLEFFKLADRPFRLTADPKYIYKADSHVRAEAYLRYVLHIRDSIAVVIGEPGTGKTMIIEDVLASLTERPQVIRIHQTQLNPTEFLIAILMQLEGGVSVSGKAELLHRLNHVLITHHREARRVVLIVDEAQNLSATVLEEIRLLSATEVDGRKVMSVILTGHPSLERALALRGGEALVQRVQLRCHIEPLTEEEIPRYIAQRLKVAGRESLVEFLPDTAPLIYRYTGGIPRLINALCDLSLVAAFMRRVTEIAEPVVFSAVEKLQWSPYALRIGGGQRTALTGKTKKDARHAAKLILRCKGRVLGEYPLERSSFLIGRGRYDDIQLDDRRVSRSHARIVNLHGEYYVQDLGSTNGTFVNERPVKRHHLQDGDTLGIGGHELMFIDEFWIPALDEATLLAGPGERRQLNAGEGIRQEDEEDRPRLYVVGETPA